MSSRCRIDGLAPQSGEVKAVGVQTKTRRVPSHVLAEVQTVPEPSDDTLLGSVAAQRVCTCRDDDATKAAQHRKETAMKIVPTRFEEQINRVDRTTALGIGIASGLTALWCVYRLIWLFYTAITLSSVGWSPVSLVFPFVLWGAIGVVAAVTAFGFLTRYAKGT